MIFLLTIYLLTIIINATMIYNFLKRLTIETNYNKRNELKEDIKAIVLCILIPVFNLIPIFIIGAFSIQRTLDNYLDKIGAQK